MRARVFLTILIAASVVLLLLARPLKSEDDVEDKDIYIEDLVAIQQIGREVIAIRDGRNPVPYKLRLAEKVLWKDSKGALGAVLTNSRFLTISVTSKGWHEISLNLHEADEASALLSPYIALLVTAKRVFGFDYMSKLFVEHWLQIDQEFVATNVNMHVAVVVSTRKALGFGMGCKTFAEIPIRVHEKFDSLETKSRLGTVLTTNRILIFHARDCLWTEIDRPIYE